MYKRKSTNTCESQITGRLNDACARYAVGKTTMRKIAKEAGAFIKVGSAALIHYGKVDKYLESLAGTQA